MTIGTGAGRQINLDIADLLFKTLSCIGTGQRPPADRQKIWQRLLKISQEQNITVDYSEFSFSDTSDAWQAQQAGPHAKIYAKLK